MATNTSFNNETTATEVAQVLGEYIKGKNGESSKLKRTLLRV